MILEADVEATPDTDPTTDAPPTGGGLWAIPEAWKRAGWYIAVVGILGGGMFAGLEVEKKRWGCVIAALAVAVVAAAVVVVKLWW